MKNNCFKCDIGVFYINIRYHSIRRMSTMPNNYMFDCVKLLYDGASLDQSDKIITDIL